MTAKHLFAGLALATLFQTAALAMMVKGHLDELARGTEVLLLSEQRDPRDFFKGHYSRISLAVRRIKLSEVILDEKLKQRGKDKISYPLDVFVGLKKKDGPYWQAVSIHTKPQTSGVFLKGKWWFPAGGGEFSTITYPLSRYYAPKKRAEELEALNAKSKLGVLLSISPEGNAKIVGVSVDGEIVHDEKLF